MLSLYFIQKSKCGAAFLNCSHSFVDSPILYHWFKRFANILFDLHQKNPPYNRDIIMSSIQIGALIYFTLIAIGAWIFFAVIFLQLKRFMDMSCYVPFVSKILTMILIVLTVLGYMVVFSPGLLEQFQFTTPSPEAPAKTTGYFDTY